jgi:hypothetical protein
MKIKRKEGPMEFLRMMKFQVDHPRAHRLLLRRKALLEHAAFCPPDVDHLVFKVKRIEKELERLDDYGYVFSS